MMKALTLFLVLLSSGLFAQSNNLNWGLPIRGVEHQDGYIDMDREIPYDEIKGSPYANEKLIKGVILMSDNDTLTRYMRLNLYTNEMEYVEKGVIKSILNPLTTNRIFLNNNIYRYARYLDLWGNKKENYLEELVSGDCELYVLNSVRFKEEEEPKNSMEKPRPQMFLPEQPVYVGSCDDRGLRIIPSKSKLDVFFGDRSSEALGFIKKNKLKVKKQEDLETLFSKLNGK